MREVSGILVQYFPTTKTTRPFSGRPNYDDAEKTL